MKAQEEKKDVICEMTFLGPLTLDVQGFRPWYKGENVKKNKIKLEKSLRNQSGCFGGMHSTSQKHWTAEMYSLFTCSLPVQHLSHYPLTLLSGFPRFP